MLLVRCWSHQSFAYTQTSTNLHTDKDAVTCICVCGCVHICVWQSIEWRVMDNQHGFMSSVITHTHTPFYLLQCLKLFKLTPPPKKKKNYIFNSCSCAIMLELGPLSSALEPFIDVVSAQQLGNWGESKCYPTEKWDYRY